MPIILLRIQSASEKSTNKRNGRDNPLYNTLPWTEQNTSQSHLHLFGLILRILAVIQSVIEVEQTNKNNVIIRRTNPYCERTDSFSRPNRFLTSTEQFSSHHILENLVWLWTIDRRWDKQIQTIEKACDNPAYKLLLESEQIPSNLILALSEQIPSIPSGRNLDGFTLWGWTNSVTRNRMIIQPLPIRFSLWFRDRIPVNFLSLMV